MEDMEALSKTILDAVTSGNWSLVAAAALLLLVLYVRKNAWVQARVPFLASKWGGVALTLVMSSVGGLVNALVAGSPFSWALAGTMLKIAFYALVPSLLKALLGMAAGNAETMKLEAEKRGLEAVKAKPAAGAESVTGKPENIE